ncbi:MAG: hypothetical protein ACREBO_01290, partial [Novosphingobium sp.]
GPYYVKFLGRDPGNGAAASEGKKDFYKGWIELNSSSVQDGNTPVNDGVLRAAPQIGAAATGTGGVRVAAGDIDGASAPGATGLSKVGAGTLVLNMRTPDCRVGERFAEVQVREGRSGRPARYKGVTVVSCASENITFSYARIEH